MISRARLKTPFCRCLEASPNSGYAGSDNSIITDVPAGYRKGPIKTLCRFFAGVSIEPRIRIRPDKLPLNNGGLREFFLLQKGPNQRHLAVFFRCLNRAQIQDMPGSLPALQPSPNLGSRPIERACETPPLCFACVSQAQIQDTLTNHLGK